MARQMQENGVAVQRTWFKRLLSPVILHSVSTAKYCPPAVHASPATGWQNVLEQRL